MNQSSLVPSRKLSARLELPLLVAVLLAATTLVMAAPVRPQNEPLQGPELLVPGPPQVIEGRYLVHLAVAPAVKRAGLSEIQATNRSERRRALATGATGLPLAHPGDLRRSFVRSDDFKQSATAAKADVETGRVRLSASLGRDLKVYQHYSVLVSGFSTDLSEDEAQRLRSAPGVISVEPQLIRRPNSDVSATFLGAHDVWSGVATGVPAKGAGVLVGILDSGVERLHPSFAAVAGVINPFGSGVFVGHCATTPALCNDKLVGVFTCTDNGLSGPFCDNAAPMPADPTDDTGHGTHVASIAVGNEVSAGYDISNPLPNISGIAPLASLISYDVCETDACPGLLDGLERAMLDGVDVINISIQGTQSPWTALDSIAARALAGAGVVVVASAGNDANPSTVTWQEPWVITVGSSSHTRDRYQATLTPIDGDAATRPAPMQVDTVGAEVGLPTPLEIVYDGGNCGPPAGTYTGEAVACEAGGTVPLNGPTYKAAAVRDAGGGAVVALFPTSAPAPLPGVIPFSRVSSMADGNALRTWLQTAPGLDGPPKVSITAGTLTTNPAFGDVISNFSSRGPVTGFDLLKPDIVAPGHWILAADYAAGHFGTPPTDIHVRRRQGTSMASPQVAGAAALLLELDPTMSAAQIKSVLQTTALHSGLRSCTAVLFPFPCSAPALPGDFFDFGAGRLAVPEAAKAGLALDETEANFADANPNTGGDPATLNIASMAKRDCPSGCAFSRTLDSLAGATVTWTGSFTSVGGDPVPPPPNLEFHVVPSSFDLTALGQQSIAVGIYATDGAVVDEWQQALLELTPSDGGIPTARMPIAIMPSSFGPSSDLAITASAVTAEFLPGDPVTFEVTVTNLGSVPAVGAAISAAQPPDVAGISWTCIGSGASLCSTASGTGALADTAALFPGDALTYSYTIADTSAVVGTEIEFTATVTPPTGLADPVGPNDAVTTESLNAQFYLIFADGFESGNTTAWQ